MLTVTVTWLTPTYEAALDTMPEWPPHPARLFCALVAAAQEGSVDDDALRWLERQGPPLVLAPAAKSNMFEAFVPTNALSNVTRSNRVARTNGARAWGRTHLAGDRAHFVWEAATPDRELLAQLDRLARKVPFFGRSTSQAILMVSDQPPEAADGLRRYEPTAAGQSRLRVAYEGYLGALRATFEGGDPARTASRFEFYGPERPGAPAEPEADAGAYATLVTLPFGLSSTLDGRLVVRATTAFKRAVLERLGQDFERAALALVHGHHDGKRRQCAFLGLPFVGHRHATGQLLGVGIALSPDLDAGVRRALLEVAGLHMDRPGMSEFHIPGLRGAVPLIPDSGAAPAARPGRWSTRPERWAGTARTWVTAYPIVLDRYPDRIEEAGAFVAQSCALAGYPEPDHVDHLAVPAVHGAQRMRGSDLRRRRTDPPRPAVHARIRFPVEVSGPVVVGHMRHLGLGLCVPESEERGGDR